MPGGLLCTVHLGSNGNISIYFWEDSDDRFRVDSYRKVQNYLSDIIGRIDKR